MFLFREYLTNLKAQPPQKKAKRSIEHFAQTRPHQKMDIEIAEEGQKEKQ
jgi:hypothetical protein